MVSQQVPILTKETLKPRLHHSRYRQFREIHGSQEFAICSGAQMKILEEILFKKPAKNPGALPYR